ncbi:HPP family protein [Streptomyces sp. NPDC085946]|uniref:HPP family protein n=1 Tax=Streptomyces sp. NPDC085946 TaxID=3365744 RepID=UPI0037D84772
MPVVDDDKVLGAVPGTDLVRARAHRADHGPAPAVTAAEVTPSPAITVHPEQTVPDAARPMERRGVERLPVVDEEDRLIGIATRRDLLRVFLRTDDGIRRRVTEEMFAGALGPPAGAVRGRVRDGVVTLDGRGGAAQPGAGGRPRRMAAGGRRRCDERPDVPRRRLRTACRGRSRGSPVTCSAGGPAGLSGARADRPRRPGPDGLGRGPSAPAAAPGSPGQWSQGGSPVPALPLPSRAAACARRP